MVVLYGVLEFVEYHPRHHWSKVFFLVDLERGS